MMEQVYSNYDHVLDEGVAKRLREAPGTKAEHVAWDFHGMIWFDGTRWCEEVSRYHAVVDNIFGDTIEDVIRVANERWGSE